jgi:hypothetical protein
MGGWSKAVQPPRVQKIFLRSVQNISRYLILDMQKSNAAVSIWWNEEIASPVDMLRHLFDQRGVLCPNERRFFI